MRYVLFDCFDVVQSMACLAACCATGWSLMQTSWMKIRAPEQTPLDLWPNSNSGWRLHPWRVDAKRVRDAVCLETRIWSRLTEHWLLTSGKVIKINAQVIKIERFLRIIEGIRIICKFWAHIFVLDLATNRKRKEPVIHESDPISRGDAFKNVLTVFLFFLFFFFFFGLYKETFA